MDEYKLWLQKAKEDLKQDIQSTRRLRRSMKKKQEKLIT